MGHLPRGIPDICRKVGRQTGMQPLFGSDPSRLQPECIAPYPVVKAFLLTMSLLLL